MPKQPRKLSDSMQETLDLIGRRWQRPPQNMHATNLTLKGLKRRALIETRYRYKPSKDGKHWLDECVFEVRQHG